MAKNCASIFLCCLSVSLITFSASAFADEEREGQRRSAERDSGPRRSLEADAGRRRSPEAERGPRRSIEGDRDRDVNSPLKDFKPQTEREQFLYQMILQLQREVADLQRTVQSRDRNVRDSEVARDEYRDTRNQIRDGQSELSPRWQFSKEGKVFKAYDKNGDLVVTLDEWLAMTNGNVSDARRQLQTQRFRAAEPSGDGEFTPAEFIHWYSKGRFENVREGRQRGPRDGEGRSNRRPRDGEGERRGPRDRD